MMSHPLATTPPRAALFRRYPVSTPWPGPRHVDVGYREPDDLELENAQCRGRLVYEWLISGLGQQ